MCYEVVADYILLVELHDLNAFDVLEPVHGIRQP